MTPRDGYTREWVECGSHGWVEQVFTLLRRVGEIPTAGLPLKAARPLGRWRRWRVLVCDPFPLGGFALVMSLGLYCYSERRRASGLWKIKLAQ